MNNIDQGKTCFFCVNNVKDIDYKDTETLDNFLGGYKKILPAKKTKVCTKHQRKLSRAVKLARVMALLPFTNR